MTKNQNLSFTLKVSALDKEPFAVSVSATKAEREALIERFGLVSLERLLADITVLNKGAQNGVLVSGQVKASLVQRCTISLADVPETLDVPFDLLLVEPEMAVRMDEAESYLDPDAPEYDALEGDIIDIGDIVAQTLSVCMDPYPRAPGASVSVPKNAHISLNEPELERPNPFAGLSKLSDKS